MKAVEPALARDRSTRLPTKSYPSARSKAAGNQAEAIAAKDFCSALRRLSCAEVSQCFSYLRTEAMPFQRPYRWIMSSGSVPSRKSQLGPPCLRPWKERNRERSPRHVENVRTKPCTLSWLLLNTRAEPLVFRRKTSRTEKPPASTVSNQDTVVERTVLCKHSASARARH